MVSDPVLPPQPPKKRTPQKPPPGRYVWLLLLAVGAALEVTALLVRQFGWTLSHAVWWAQGPVGEPRWMLLGWPIFAFLLWVAVHFLVGAQLADRYANGPILAVMVGVAFVAALVAVVVRAL